MSTAPQPITNFDPDAFMASRQKKDFDPDKFMASKQGTGQSAEEPWYERGPRKFLRSAGLPESLSDIPRWAGSFTGNVVGEDPNYKPAWEPIGQAIKHPTQENIVGSVPYVGSTAVQMSHDVQSDHPLDALWSLGGAIAMPKVASQVKPGLAAGKSELAEVGRNPEGGLTKTAANVGRVGTAAVLHGAGVPLGEAGLAGGMFGRTLADTIVPERPPKPSLFGAYEEPPIDMQNVKGVYTPISQSPNYGRMLAARREFLKNSSVSPIETEGVRGSVAKPSGRLVLLPEEASAEARMQELATRRASQHGMLYAAGMRPAGTGRVPMTPTPTRTVEFSGARPEPIGPQLPAPQQKRLALENSVGFSDIPSQPIDPRELAEMSERLGRNISASELPEIRRRLLAEQNVEEGLNGNRRDAVGEIREKHRAKLEKKREH